MLRFFWDKTPERAERLEQLLDSIAEPNVTDEDQEN